jgi:hypothetical protein
MKAKNAIGILLIMALMILMTAFDLPQQASQPNGYDLVAAVNAYRASKGYYALNPNSQVMAAAQAHAEWIVSTGQGGHIGANGSNETMRVSWTGYGGGASIHCDECWASGRTIEDALYGAWSDWTHQEVMLNAWGNRYTDAGGGVAALGNGRYIFILDVCLVNGKSSEGAVPGATTNPQATADLSNYIYGVTRATPKADGRIEHTVKYGQTLASIAKAYDTSVEELRKLNKMAADATIIYPDQVLLIQSGTGAASAATATPPLPSPSPMPSATISVPTITSSPTLAKTRTPDNPTPTPVKENGRNLENAAIILVAISAIGLMIVLFSLLIKQ